MKNITFGIVGVGGRTGTMFAFELGKATDVLGIAREREVELVRQRKLFISNGPKNAVFKEKVIKDTEFNNHSPPDVLFVATKNPVSPVLKFYLSSYEKKIPSIFLSQNGIAAIEDAKNAVKEIFGRKSEEVKIIRVSLFNPIDQQAYDGGIRVKYSLPIRGAMAKAWGKGNIEAVKNIFREAGFEFDYFPDSEAQNLAFSKLFLNLIGMASASRGLSIREGFERKEVFTEEVRALKEYIKAVHKSGGRFINFSHYPVRTFTSFIGNLPLFLLLPLRNVLAKVISKGREGKPKVLDEIEYYNGGVVDLGNKTDVRTPVNKRICERALKHLSDS